MTRVGRYNASYDGVNGSLFVYGEAPVTSTKLNRWDGNIEAGFWLMHRALRLLTGTDESSRVIGHTGSDPLKVCAQATADLTVRVLPGILVGPACLAGLSIEESLPIDGAFTPPTSNPRIDSIGILESGEWTIVTGTEAASPVAPELPAGAVRLADVFLRVGTTAIHDEDGSTQAYLIDRRPAQITCQAHQHTSLSSFADVQIEGSLEAEGPVEFGDSTHTLSVFQAACEGTAVANSSGIPALLYDGQEGYWYPRQAGVAGVVSFTCPLPTPGTRIREVKLILQLASSSETFNLSVSGRSSQIPESLAAIVEYGAPEYTNLNCSVIGGDFYRYTQSLNYTLPADTQIWVNISLEADSSGPDCCLLGMEWVFEGRRY